tara:strand:- start:344 stop:643 length:300 start_codon:yes stop_codon:yes gene_type:complete
MKIKYQEPIPAKYKDLSLKEVYQIAIGHLFADWTLKKSCIDRMVLLIKLYHEEIIGSKKNFTVILGGYRNLKLLRVVGENDILISKVYSFLKEKTSHEI